MGETASKTDLPSRTDVVIAGAGLAGLTLASALGQAGVATVLVEPQPPETLIAPEFDGRTTAVAASSQRIFDSLGVWPGVVGKAEPILDIRVADGGSPIFVHYDHRDVEAEALGWIVENRDLRAALLERVTSLDSVTLLPGRRVEATRPGMAGTEVRLADGGEVAARLVVGADGRNSPLRQMAGIEVMEWRYDQTAIVCTVEHDRPHRGIAHEHFLTAGPFAILPMTGDRSSIVWAEKSSLAEHILALPDAVFLEELTARFGDFLGSLNVTGPVFSYPLGLMNAQRYTAPRLALIADAAHVIHPIAGQGINIGWRDAAALAEVIVNALRLGLDPGADDALARYQEWRRTDNLVMIAATDGLNRLFSNDIAPVRAARNIGLGAVQKLPPLKRMFMRHAMGDLGDLPRLLRGLPV